MTKKTLSKGDTASKSSQPRHELLSVAELVAREKDITKEEVLQTIELAMERVAFQQYGQHSPIQVNIDRATGEVLVTRHVEVVNEVSDCTVEISLQKAKVINAEINIGDMIDEPLPPIEFDRVAAQVARQVINQKVKEAERAHQYEEFKDRVGEIINSIVKRVEFGNVIVELGRTEAILRREDAIPRESFAVGDRLRAIIAELRPDAHGQMVILSRTHPLFLVKLFEQEVPEIYDDIIEIKAVARDPGSRSKIAVFSKDANLDPVGSCVGLRGARVQAVTSELQGEKVDIIPWAANPATFIVNALAPAEVLKVILDEEENEVSAIVDNEQLSLAIGRRGQNVRLAAQLTGFRIEVLTEEADSNRRSIEMVSQTSLFMKALDVDELFAQLLVTEGFHTMQDIIQARIEDFRAIEGFDHNLVQEVQERAIEYIKNEEKHFRIHSIAEGMEPQLANCPLINMAALTILLESLLLMVDDLAELSTDELIDILGEDVLPREKVQELILWARSSWFTDEQ